jgi:hypothetical protein
VGDFFSYWWKDPSSKPAAHSSIRPHAPEPKWGIAPDNGVRPTRNGVHGGAVVV